MTKKKLEYTSVQIPKKLIGEIQTQIEGYWYRSHHEFIMECIRMGLRKLIKIKSLRRTIYNKKNEKNYRKTSI
jgi:Arc/MetJ-type ribon-helix-helix transcriptional regulator